MNRCRHLASLPPRRGFTMLELVVVVLIIGMLAAIASSNIANTANNAKSSSARKSLAVIRNAIDLHLHQHGKYPGQNGDEQDFKRDMATMLRTPFPACPVGNTNDKVHVDGNANRLSAGGPKGWRYNKTTGEFIINHRDYSSW